MKASSYRPCVTLALLSLLLATALAVDINARHNGVTVPAHVAGTMQLQGTMETDEDSAAPDADEHISPSCAQRDRNCPSFKKEFVLAQSDDRVAQDGKPIAAPNDDEQAEVKR